MTRHSQRDWWVRKKPVSNLVEYPLVSSLGEMNTIPINLAHWIATRFRDHDLVTVDGLLAATLVVTIVIIFPTMSTTRYKWVFKSFKFHRHQDIIEIIMIK